MTPERLQHLRAIGAKVLGTESGCGLIIVHLAEEIEELWREAKNR